MSNVAKRWMPAAQNSVILMKTLDQYTGTLGLCASY
jgi:hypothetical protein